MSRQPAVKIGTTVSGKSIGKDSAKYIRGVCIDCGKERWIRLSHWKNKPYSMCVKCAIEKNTKRLNQLNRLRGLRLTEKEFHTLTLLKRGYKGKEVAFIMGCKPGIHYRRCCRIYRKLGVKTAAGAIGKVL